MLEPAHVHERHGRGLELVHEPVLVHGHVPAHELVPEHELHGLVHAPEQLELAQRQLLQQPKQSFEITVYISIYYYYFLCFRDRCSRR